jgi:hypothetical protein
MLQAAQQAEEDYCSVQRAAQEAVGLSQAFISGGMSVAAAAFPSQAEMTLARYSSGGGHSLDGSSKDSHRRKRNGKVGLWPCFGCGSPHPWSEYREDKHVILCPNKNDPGILENANRNIERMRKHLKKRQSQSQERKNLGMANFSDIDESG